MSKGIEHRLTILERGAGIATEPPAPKYEPAYYLHYRAIRFDGPGRVRMAALWDDSGDIATAVAWLNWHLRIDSGPVVLLDSEECSQALSALTTGKIAVDLNWRPGDACWPCYPKNGGIEALTLSSMVGSAVGAWMDQGQPVELTHAGVMALLQGWAGAQHS